MNVATKITNLRWEWRSFGRNFGEAEKVLETLTPTGIQESDELYLLSGSDDNVKVRYKLLDIKVLRETDPAGLEKWEPVMKLEFPLSGDDAAKVLSVLHCQAPALLEDHYSCHEFLHEFAGRDASIRHVKVHKRRVRYVIEGCTSELSEVVANGKSTRTIAVESEDGAAVLRAVDRLGLNGYVNTGYPKGLADLLDGAAERYAVIDVGTNSVKFHLGERKPDGKWRTLADSAEVTRLGEDLDRSGVIGNEALERTVAAISGMVDEARSQDVRAIAAVGTAGLRIAGNGAEVAEVIRQRTGAPLEVISGDDEARLAFRATRAALGKATGSLTVFDTGGGSSQFTFGHGDAIDERFSVNVGAVGYTDKFGLDSAVSDDVMQQALAAISADLAQLAQRKPPDMLVGMGGAVTNLTAVSHKLARYNPEVVQGSVLTAEEIDRQIELYSSRDAAARRSIVGLQPNRAEVILAGACIVRTIMRKLGKDRLTVSDRGLRHGVLVEKFGG